MRFYLYASLFYCITGGSVRGEVSDDVQDAVDSNIEVHANTDVDTDIGDVSFADIDADIKADIEDDAKADIDASSGLADIDAGIKADIEDKGTDHADIEDMSLADIKADLDDMDADSRPKPEDEAARKAREERKQKYASEVVNLKSGPFKVDPKIADELADARERHQEESIQSSQGENGDFVWKPLGKRDLTSLEEGTGGDGMAKIERLIHKERGTVQKGQIAYPRSPVEKWADKNQELRDGKEMPDARFYAPKSPDSSRRQLVEGVTLTSADGKKIIGKQENGGVETEFSQKPGEKDQVMSWNKPLEAAEAITQKVEELEEARSNRKPIQPSIGTSSKGQMISAVEQRGDLAVADARETRDVALAASNLQTSIGAYLNRRKEIDEETDQLFHLKHKHEDTLETLEHSYDVLLGELGRIMQAKDDVQATNEFRVLIQLAKRISNERRIVKEFTKRDIAQRRTDTKTDEDVSFSLNEQAKLVDSTKNTAKHIQDDLKGLEKVAGYESDPEASTSSKSSFVGNGPRSTSALETHSHSIPSLDMVDPYDIV